MHFSGIKVAYAAIPDNPDNNLSLCQISIQQILRERGTTIHPSSQILMLIHTISRKEVGLS